MKLLDWPDVCLVVKTMIENKINLDYLNEDDSYLIEKLTDSVFEKVKKTQLLEQKNQNIIKDVVEMQRSANRKAIEAEKFLLQADTPQKTEELTKYLQQSNAEVFVSEIGEVTVTLPSYANGVHFKIVNKSDKPIKFE